MFSKTKCHHSEILKDLGQVSLLRQLRSLKTSPNPCIDIDHGQYLSHLTLFSHIILILSLESFTCTKIWVQCFEIIHSELIFTFDSYKQYQPKVCYCVVLNLITCVMTSKTKHKLDT